MSLQPCCTSQDTLSYHLRLCPTLLTPHTQHVLAWHWHHAHLLTLGIALTRISITCTCTTMSRDTTYTQSSWYAYGRHVIVACDCVRTEWISFGMSHTIDFHFILTIFYWPLGSLQYNLVSPQISVHCIRLLSDSDLVRSPAT